MPQISKIDLMPDDLRTQLDNKLITAGFGNYSELTSWLNRAGYEISRSVVGAYGKNFKERMEALKIVTAQAKALQDHVGDDAGALNDALLRMAQEKLFTLMLELHLDEKNISKITNAIAHLCSASVSQTRIASQIKAEQNKQLDKAVQGGALDSEAANKARQIMGLNAE